jgi:hypothetical protein
MFVRFWYIPHGGETKTGDCRNDTLLLVRGFWTVVRSNLISLTHIYLIFVILIVTGLLPFALSPDQF